MISERTIQAGSYVSQSKLPASDYVINPYVGCPHKCIYCYAEFMKRFTDHKEPWGDFIDVKLCDKPINAAKYAGKSIAISSVTDPYNPYEKKYEITRGILKSLCGCAAEITIITKSDLVLRDVDILKDIPDVTCAVSMNSLDDTVRRNVELHAPSVSRRLAALKGLHEAGLRTVLFMSPIFPLITNVRALLDATKDFVDEYWFENLNLRSGYRTRVLTYVFGAFPQYRQLYEDIYLRGNPGFWDTLSDELPRICGELGITQWKNYFHHERIRKQ